MRFFLDEMFSDAIAAAAKLRGLDVTSALGAGQHGDDEAQLLYAASEGRCVVTKNGTDFEKLTLLFQEHNLAHAGVLVVSKALEGNEYSAIVDRLVYWHELYPAGADPYFFGYL